MPTTTRRHYWKEAIIFLLVVLLVVALVWLFLRPEQPGRQIVFGDLGQKNTQTNSVSRAPTNPTPNVVPPLNTNSEFADGVGMTNARQTNSPVTITNAETAMLTNQPAIFDNRAKRNAIFGAIARNASNALAGRHVAVTNFDGGPGTNSMGGGTNLMNAIPSNGIAANPAMQPLPGMDPTATQGAAPVRSNATAMPRSAAPTPGYSYAATAPHPKFVPEEEAPPLEPANKASTSTLLAEAGAAGVKRLTPAPQRTSDLLGTPAPPILFDTRFGTNVVFLVDNSLSMMTNGKSAMAREALVHSLETMDPLHSFYVILFHDGGFEGMPSLGPRPALPENIEAMTNWLFSAGHRSGSDPTKAIQRAFGLAPSPDAIWILAGGAIPESSIDVIRDANASIHARIFTIGYQTRVTEDVLRQIANENRGAYRYVSPPDAP